MTRNLSFTLILFLLVLTACNLPEIIKPNTFGRTTVNTPNTPTTPTAGTPASTAAEYYFKGIFDGKAVNWSATNTSPGWASGWSVSSSIYQGDITAALCGKISERPKYDRYIGVEFKTINIPYGVDRTGIFRSFVTTGAWNYATDDRQVVGTKFLAVIYVDAAGNEYNTIAGSQTGSVANVVSATYFPAVLGNDEIIKVKVTFSCKLYPVDINGQPIAGQPIVITSGEATLQLPNVQ